MTESLTERPRFTLTRWHHRDSCWSHISAQVADCDCDPWPESVPADEYLRDLEPPADPRALQ